MGLTRKQVIEELNTVRLEWGELVPPEDALCEALDYAISSLKTDETYQIMYEGGEIFTKVDLVAMLTEIQLKIEENQIIAPQDTFYDKKLDGQFNRGISKASEIIQQKIDKLKEGKDGENNN